MTPLNYNPHSLTLVTPNPTSSPSTQLFLVYNTYEYPHREEEKDSRMAGFKLGVFDREAHLIGPQESCCSTIGRSQKAVWILAQPSSFREGASYFSNFLLFLLLTTYPSLVQSVLLCLARSLVSRPQSAQVSLISKCTCMMCLAR